MNCAKMRNCVIQHGRLSSGCVRVASSGLFRKPPAAFLWYLMVAISCISAVAQNTHSPRTGCPKEFLGRCHCGMVFYEPTAQLTYVTNCTNTGFTTAGMLSELPIETEVLIFTGNEVKDLPYNIFGKDAVYPKLHTVDLSNNRIQTIKGKTFHRVDSVKKLILNNNDLYIVSKDFHPRIFSNFVNLEELHLRNIFSEKKDSRRGVDYIDNLAKAFLESDMSHLHVLNLEDNEIETFNDGGDIFCSLPALEELYLAENRLSDVSMKLTCLKHLRKLDVSHNYIAFLSNETLNHLTNISGLQLNLTSNRFMCDCNMIDMYKWLVDKRNSLIGKDSYLCSSGFPPKNVGKQIFSLSLQDMQCPLYEEYEDDHPATIYVIVSIVFIFLAAVAVFFLVRNRATVQVFFRRYLEPIRSKYASLDRRDESFMDV